MYPTTTLALECGDPGSQARMKTCRLCFSECDEINELDYNSKLPSLCCKYLHSSFTEEMSGRSDNLSFCSKCFVSAMELIVLSDQMEFVQKSISDLVLIFSLEILHRRGKTQDSNTNLIEFDVSALPNSNSWNIPTPPFDKSNPIASTPDEMTHRNITGLENENEDPLLIPDLTENEVVGESPIDEIKRESVMELWIEEGTMETENPIETENIASLNTRILNPVLQIPKMKFESDGRKIIVETNPENIRINEMQVIGGNVWTKSDSGSSYKVTQQNQTSSLQHWNMTPMLQPYNPSLSVPVTILNDAAPHFSERPIVETFAGFSRNGPNNENPCRRPSFKTIRRFKPRSEKSAHKREKAYRCSICTKSFDRPASLQFHHQLQHGKEQPFKCSHCGKGFILKWDLIRHTRTHTGEKPFKCDKCDYAATVRVCLQSHIKNHHTHNVSQRQPDTSRLYKCKECENIFNTANDMEMHFKRNHFGLRFSKDCYTVEGDNYNRH